MLFARGDELTAKMDDSIILFYGCRACAALSAQFERELEMKYLSVFRQMLISHRLSPSASLYEQFN